MLDLRGRNWLKPLREHLGATTFIETGTYRGDGIRAALGSGFGRIITCDTNEAMVQDARREFVYPGSNKVWIWCCDSVHMFHRLHSHDFRDHPPVVFWLDAHWFPALGPKPKGYVCPLMDELTAVLNFKQRCGVPPCVLVDDVVAFNDPELDFPSLGIVLDLVREIAGSDIRILDSHIPRNVIAAIPPKE